MKLVYVLEVIALMMFAAFSEVELEQQSEKRIKRSVLCNSRPGGICSLINRPDDGNSDEDLDSTRSGISFGGGSRRPSGGSGRSWGDSPDGGSWGGSWGGGAGGPGSFGGGPGGGSWGGGAGGPGSFGGGPGGGSWGGSWGGGSGGPGSFSGGPGGGSLGRGGFSGGPGSWGGNPNGADGPFFQ